MYKQILFVITTAIMLTAFATIALYTASEAHAQAPAGGNASAAGANATAAGANATAAGNKTNATK